MWGFANLKDVLQVLIVPLTLAGLWLLLAPLAGTQPTQRVRTFDSP
jgi:hypothetical protein